MLWALVMAGGSGTRLWPLSRRKMPKPLLKLLPGRDSLLSETVKRLSPLIRPRHMVVIGNQEHLGQLRKCVRGIPKAHILGEPVARNTAPTVAFGASFILKRDPNAVILVLPADHWIGAKPKFHKAIRRAAQVSALTNSFSIFGVEPTFPSSSYGYLRMGKKISPLTPTLSPKGRGKGEGYVYELKQFVEKPTVRKAEAFLRTGRFLWHAGIFLAPAKLILESIRKYAPEINRRLSKLDVRANMISPARLFRLMPNVSIDYAVLEKLDSAYLVRCDFDWCDVGTWKSFDQLWPKDPSENSAVGENLFINSKRNVVYGKEKMICLHGVDDLVVVDTPDALLVSHKNSAEKIREVLENLGRKKRTQAKYS